MKDGIVLTMRGICKRFPGVMALDRVDFTLRKGEIHALMGENGAGKSTLIKVLTGVYAKDAGEIHVDGVEEAISIRSPQEAQSYGISTVYQEISLCPWAFRQDPGSSSPAALSRYSRWWPSPARWIPTARS